MIKWWKNPQVGMRIQCETGFGICIQTITGVDERGWITSYIERCDWLPVEQWQTTPLASEYRDPSRYSSGRPEEWKLDESLVVQLTLAKYEDL